MRFILIILVALVLASTTGCFLEVDNKKNKVEIEVDKKEMKAAGETALSVAESSLYWATEMIDSSLAIVARKIN